MQGKPSAAYNPKANEYIVAFQVTATKLFGGKTCIVAQRIRTARTDKVANPQLLLKATDNSRGRQVFIPVQNPKIVYNPITSKLLYIYLRSTGLVQTAFSASLRKEKRFLLEMWRLLPYKCGS